MRTIVWQTAWWTAKPDDAAGVAGQQRAERQRRAAGLLGVGRPLAISAAARSAASSRTGFASGV